MQGDGRWVGCVSMSAEKWLIMSGSTEDKREVLKIGDEKWGCTVLECHSKLVSCVSLSADGTKIRSGMLKQIDFGR